MHDLGSRLRDQNSIRAWLLDLGSHPDVTSQAGSAREAADLIAVIHGSDGAAFADLAMFEGAPRADLYAAKNAKLDLSLDASLLWSLPLYERQLSALAELIEASPPTRIIDLGCEQGLVTCFAAMAAPTATVVGLDPCSEAIDRARELADRLGLGNVGFIVAEAIGDESAIQGVAPADLLLTSRALLGEAIDDSSDRPAELLAGKVPADPAWVCQADAAARRLADLALPGARLFAIERTGTSGLVRWARSLSGAGFELATPTIRVSAPEPGNPDQVFRLVNGTFRGRPCESPPTHLLLGPEASEPTGEWSGEQAERIALSAAIEVPLGAWQWVNSVGDTEHLELASLSGGRLLELRCSTNGSRHVRIKSESDPADALSRLSRAASASAGQTEPSAKPVLDRRPQAVS